MKRLTRFLLVACVLIGLIAVSFPAAAQEAPALDTTAVDALVADLMDMYDIPGVSLAIVDDGQLVYASGYGVRDVASGDLVDEHTQFFIGSITKSFTSLAVAQLVDQGVLDLDTPIIEYLPDFSLSDPEATQQLTLRHLLSHSGGFVPDDLLWYSGQVASRDELIAAISELEVTSEPGTRYEYNNIGYTLVGYVVEQVTGESWEDYVRQHILEPLGMTETTVTYDDFIQSANHASPHMLDILDGMQPIPYMQTISLAAPAGAINSTALDMAAYTLFQLGDGTYNGEPIVSEAMLDEMHTAQIDGYAMGWVVGEYEGYETVLHDGAIDGWSAMVVTVPSEELGVVVLTNAEGYGGGFLFTNALPTVLIGTILNIEPDRPFVEVLNENAGFVSGERDAELEAVRAYQADVDIADYAWLLGDYDSPLGDMSIVEEDGTLFFRADVGTGTAMDFEMTPASDTTFLVIGLPYRGTYSEFRFERDEQGTITIFQDDVQIARRLGEGVEATETIYSDPQGRFSVTIPTNLIFQDVNGLAIASSGDPAGTFVFGAAESTGDDLEAGSVAFVQGFDPTFNLEPTATNSVPMPDGPTWTQYVYDLPTGQFLAVTALRQDGIDYFILLQANPQDSDALLPSLNALLLSFEIPAE